VPVFWAGSQRQATTHMPRIKGNRKWGNQHSQKADYVVATTGREQVPGIVCRGTSLGCAQLASNKISVKRERWREGAPIEAAGHECREWVAMGGKWAPIKKRAPHKPTRGLVDICNGLLELLPQVAQQRPHLLRALVQPVTLPAQRTARHNLLSIALPLPPTTRVQQSGMPASSDLAVI
jgi:hypothetical protein